MKRLLILSLLIITSCVNGNLNKHDIENSQLETENIYDTFFFIEGSRIQLTFEILNQDQSIFKSILDNEVSHIDTLWHSGLGEITLFLFDSDSIPDLLISYHGNNISQELYQFDSSHLKFRKIENFIQFPESEKVLGTSDLYYSYHRAGCADVNWVSDLFKIENFKAIHLAHLMGRECEGEEQDIKVFRNNIAADSLILVENLSIDTLYHYEDKWKFIQEYWRSNHRKFK